jgi:hypothetical protein
MKNYKKQLKKIIEKTDNNLIKHVGNYILEDYSTNDEIKGFFEDLSHGGCASGMIGGLIYYNETSDFFIKFQDEIEELKEELEDSIGEPLKIKGRITNWLAWFGFEETARNLALKLEIY